MPFVNEATGSPPVVCTRHYVPRHCWGVSKQPQERWTDCSAQVTRQHTNRRAHPHELLFLSKPSSQPNWGDLGVVGHVFAFIKVDTQPTNQAYPLKVFTLTLAGRSLMICSPRPDGCRKVGQPSHNSDNFIVHIDHCGMYGVCHNPPLLQVPKGPFNNGAWRRYSPWCCDFLARQLHPVFGEAGRDELAVPLEELFKQETPVSQDLVASFKQVHKSCAKEKGKRKVEGGGQ